MICAVIAKKKGPGAGFEPAANGLKGDNKVASDPHGGVSQDGASLRLRCSDRTELPRLTSVVRLHLI